jgi:chromosome segregation ATPase
MKYLLKIIIGVIIFVLINFAAFRLQKWYYQDDIIKITQYNQELDSKRDLIAGLESNLETKATEISVLQSELLTLEKPAADLITSNNNAKLYNQKSAQLKELKAELARLQADYQAQYLQYNQKANETIALIEKVNRRKWYLLPLSLY